MNEPVEWQGAWWRQASDGSWWTWDPVAFHWKKHEESPPTTTPSGPRAGFMSRLGAGLIDALIVSGLTFVLAWPWGGAELVEAIRGGDPLEVTRQLEAVGAVWNLIGLLTPFLYRVPLEGSRRGQTFGKRLLGIRLIDQKTSAPAGYATAALRLLASWISALALGIGYLVMLGNEERQTWHDRWTGTVVVPVSAYPPPEA